MTYILKMKKPGNQELKLFVQVRHQDRIQTGPWAFSGAQGAIVYQSFFSLPIEIR